MIKLHCLAEQYLDLYPLNRVQQNQARECVLKYTSPKSSLLSLEKINYLIFRIFNALKSLVRKSEWQKTTNNIVTFYPKEMHSGVQEMTIRMMAELLFFHSTGLEAPKDLTSFKNCAAVIRGDEVATGDVVFIDEETFERLTKCEHGVESYWDKKLPEMAQSFFHISKEI